MSRCKVCGQLACTSRHYRPPTVPDLLNEGGKFVATVQKEPTITLPRQYVRPGRGTAGYKGANVKQVDTEKSLRQRAVVGTTQPKPRATKASLRAKLDELGVEAPARANLSQLEALLAEAEA